MRSYAAIDRITGNYAVCEVELMSTEESNPWNYDSKETCMIDIPLALIVDAVGEVKESDVLVVEHICGKVCRIICKSDDEKAARVYVITEMFKK